jgi:hypothetical protein
MKQTIFFFLLFLYSFKTTAQIGVGFGRLGLPFQFKTSPTHKNGVLARLSFSGGASGFVLTPQVAYLRRFAYQENYNFYVGAGIGYSLTNIKTTSKKLLGLLPMLGVETRPFRKNKQWVVAFESGGLLTEKRPVAYATVDFTYYLKK